MRQGKREFRGRQERDEGCIPAPRIQGRCNTPSNVRRSVVYHGKVGIAEDADGALRLVCQDDTVTGVVERCC